MTKPVRILSFDISASPGAALIEIGADKKPKLIAVDHVVTSSDNTDAERYAIVEAFTTQFLQSCGKVDEIIREKFLRGGSKRSTQLVFGAWASIDRSLATFGHTIPDANEIVASTAKKLVGGNGRASKDEVGEGVIRLLGEVHKPLFYTERGRLLDDRADACALALAWAMREGYIDETS